MAGDSVTLTFTIENQSLTESVEHIGFTDDLDNVLLGLVATDLPKSNICGPGSQFKDTSIDTGKSYLALSGAVLDPEESCTFSVELAIPVTTSAGDYLNTTSSLYMKSLPFLGPATAVLTVLPANVPPVVDVANTSSR